MEITTISVGTSASVTPVLSMSEREDEPTTSTTVDVLEHTNPMATDDVLLPTVESDVKAQTSAAIHKASGDDGLLVPAVVSILSGLLFGIAIHKSGVYDADVLRHQFDFSNNTMLKIFLSATATSTLAVAFMYQTALASTLKAITKTYTHANGLISALVGAFMLGAGMTVAGACPGTVWVQLGAGSWVSAVTIAGGLLAVVVYSFIVPYLGKFLKLTTLSKPALTDWFGEKNRTILALVLALCMYGLVAVLEVFVPGVPLRVFGDMTIPSWSPVFCGVLIGGLQVLLTLGAGKNLGSSSSFVTLAGNMFAFLGSKFPYLNSKKTGMNNWWQVIYLAAAVGGSALCSWLAAEPVYAPNVSWGEALGGGFLLVFGSRMASGCTSGHGISGAAHMSINSFGAICSMFAGAIFAGFFML